MCKHLVSCFPEGIVWTPHFVTSTPIHTLPSELIITYIHSFLPFKYHLVVTNYGDNIRLENLGVHAAPPI